MCITEERNSLICGHRASHTKVCKKKTGGSLLNILRKKCSPTVNYVNYHELCHNCRRFWQTHGVPEEHAIERVLLYRNEHDYPGPVSPHSYHPNSPPTILRDGDLEAAFHLAQNAAATEPGESANGNPMAERVNEPTNYERGLREWVVSFDDEEPNEAIEGRTKLKARSSQRTLWPSIPTPINSTDPSPQEPQEASLHRQTSHSIRDSCESILIGMRRGEELMEPDKFELGNLNEPLSGSVDRHGFERQSLYWTLSRPSPSQQVPSGQRAASDLMKPLPRPPTSG